ncbi:MAG TPA: metallophosphoesterase [Clostridiales bacterium]|nr:metallophosphoesterase [Clostridiales bacterium]HQK73797.1 metallophosphoesterase [Clostridiales bacterium]
MPVLRVLILIMVAVLTSLNLYPAAIAGNTAVIDRPDEPVLRFVVCSDIHMENESSCRQYGRLEKLFEYSYAYAQSQAYASIDAFVFAGDIITSGTRAQANNVVDIVNRCKRPETPLMCVYDNHDIGGGNTIADCEQWLGVPANEDRVINGFHFITVSYNDDHSFFPRLPSLYRQLSAAKKENPEKPIFVFNHRHIQGTVYGSTVWGTAQLSPVLNLFPQVIDFSGHSHYPVNDPRSCSQYFFTSFGCGTLSYVELEDGMSYGSVPPGAEATAQFYIVEVYADNAVAVLPFNIMTGEFFTVPSSYSEQQLIYYVTNPSDRSGFSYTNARYKTADAPVWPQGAQAAVGNFNAGRATVSFPQALDGEEIHHYTLVLKKGGRTVGTYRFFSGFYFEPMPPTVSWTLENLEPGTGYSIEITGFDTYMKQTKAPLTAEFTTPAE